MSSTEEEDRTASTDSERIPLLLEFEGRPHLAMVGEGWEEIAAAIDNWLEGVLGTATAALQRGFG